MSAWTYRLRQGRRKDCSILSSNPMMEGPWCRFRREARARERHQHCRWVDSLKALDPERPIREADIGRRREATQPLRVAIFALGRDVIWRCARPAFGARTLTAFGSPERKSVIQGWLHPNAISAFRHLFSWA
jgi:hypothetical protein